jgi:hypothetical protein
MPRSFPIQELYAFDTGIRGPIPFKKLIVTILDKSKLVALFCCTFVKNYFLLHGFKKCAYSRH